jgi:hypothetical protein
MRHADTTSALLIDAVPPVEIILHLSRPKSLFVQHDYGIKSTVVSVTGIKSN